MNPLDKLLTHLETLEKATPGPYILDHCGDLRHEDGSAVLLTDDLEANENFISASRSAMPKLLEMLRVAMGALEGAHNAFADITRCCGNPAHLCEACEALARIQELAKEIEVGMR